MKRTPTSVKCVLNRATLAKIGSSNRLALVKMLSLPTLLTEGRHRQFLYHHQPQDAHHPPRHLRAAFTVTVIEAQTVDHHLLPHHLCHYCHHRIHLIVTRIDQIPRVNTVARSPPTLLLDLIHLKRTKIA